MAAVLTKHYDLVLCNTATTGTGNVTVGAAVAPYMNFAQAGVPNGATISYSIIDVAGGNSETGWGVVTLTGSTYTFTRNVLASTNSGSAISLSGSATISIDILSQDLQLQPVLLGTTTLTSAAAYLQDATSLALTGYESYTVKLSNIAPAAGGVGIYAQFYSNGAWQTSGYEDTLCGVGSGGMGTAQSYSTSSICLAYPNSIGITGNWQGWSAAFDIPTPTADNTCLFGYGGGYSSSNGGPMWNGFAGGLVTAYPVTGIRIFASSGNITGVMKIYGNP
jgi:hypothetical protein